jgi:hypothetical protein
MLTMFLSFLTERAEQGVLEEVDRFVDHELAHRFERAGGDSGEFTTVVRQHTQVMIQAAEKLVQRQAEVWAKTFDEMQQGRAAVELKMQQQITTGIETALEKTLETHARRLAAFEQHANEQSLTALEKLAGFTTAVRQVGQEQLKIMMSLSEGLAAQTEALTRLQEGERQLLEHQSQMNQNLAAVVRALEGFEFRLGSTEFRLRLEAQEMKPEIRAMRPNKAA